MKHRQFDEDRLIRPNDHFYPLDAYQKLFGDPRSRENRDKGHYITRKYGDAGVVVPGGDWKTPWVIERARGSRIEKSEELHENASSDDEGIIDRKFNDLAREREEDHNTTCVGMVQSELAKHADPGAMAEDSTVRVASKRKPVPKAKEYKADEEGQVVEVTKRRKLVHTLSEISDDIDNPGSGKATAARAPKAKAKAKTSASSSEKAKGGGGASGGGGGGGASVGSADKGARGGGSPASLAGEPRSVGRPSGDPAALLDEIKATIVTADSSSHFFGEQHAVKLRQVHRGAAKAGEKAIGASAPDAKMKWEIVQKSLAVVETVIKVQKAWDGRKTLASAKQFLQSWNALQVFMKTEPVCGEELVPILLHRSHLDARVAHFFASDETVCMLTLQRLEQDLRLGDAEAVKREQSHLVRLGFMGLFSDSQSSTEAVAKLLSQAALLPMCLPLVSPTLSSISAQMFLAHVPRCLLRAFPSARRLCAHGSRVENAAETNA